MTAVRERHDVRKAAWIVVSIGLLLAAGLFAALISAVPSPRNESGAEPLIDRNPPQRTQNRQVYSPIIAKDPYVVDQWEKSIQALEAACAKRGEYCEEARQARRSVNR
ncbi:MAG TPA: hypothetical protein VN034_09375 [Sphingopyxis sp.]|nr:hypothetical protein [Sphingopyxis sp.]